MRGDLQAKEAVRQHTQADFLETGFEFDGLLRLTNRLQIRKRPKFRRRTFTHESKLMAADKICHCFVWPGRAEAGIPILCAARGRSPSHISSLRSGSGGQPLLREAPRAEGCDKNWVRSGGHNQAPGGGTVIGAETPPPACSGWKPLSSWPFQEEHPVHPRTAERFGAEILRSR